MSWRYLPRPLNCAATGTGAVGRRATGADPSVDSAAEIYTAASGDRGSECSLDHFDLAGEDGGSIEAHRPSPAGALAQVSRGETSHPLLLARGDRLEAGAEAVGRSGLHLTDDQIGAVGDDEVELTLGATPIALKNSIAALDVPARSAVLAEAAQGLAVGRHTRGVAMLLADERVRSASL